MTKQGAKKAGGGKAAPARASSRPRTRGKVRRPSARPTTRGSITKRKKTLNEAPPKDHATLLTPLFLAAGHGHLTRAVDAGWKSILQRYRQAFAEAIAYERKRSPEARLAFAQAQAQKLGLLVASLTARAQLLIGDLRREMAADLAHEIIELTKLLGDLAVGLLRGVKFEDQARAAQVQQLQNNYASQVARAADLARRAEHLKTS